MEMTFRWYGEDDKVRLDYIRQIPGVKGIVSAIYDIPPGEPWPLDKILSLKNKVEQFGLTLSVIESVPVHEDIKLGKPSRDQWIENYKQTLVNLAKAEVKTVCYNFMPVFDWTRSELQFQLEDGSNTLAYINETIEKMNPVSGDLSLPGWDVSYKKEDLVQLFNEYKSVTEEDLWSHLTYFLKEVIPVAEEMGINMAIHPDDPPWSIFGLPRIITNQANLDRFLQIVDSPNNGITFCTGSLGADSNNNLPDMIRQFGSKGRIHFAHARNIKVVGEKSFIETSHRSSDGSVNMVEILKAFRDIGYEGPLRPDHGRMIWGETGRPGYGLYDRALGAVYLNGIWEALQ